MVVGHYMYFIDPS